MAPRPTVSNADKLQTHDTSLNRLGDEVTGPPCSQKTKEARGPSRRKGKATMSGSVEAATTQASRKELAPG